MTCEFSFAGTFSPFSLAAERTAPAGEDEIAMCDGTNLRQALAKANVVIPMMPLLDETLMEAQSFGLVQQWGSGLASGPRRGLPVWHLGGQRVSLLCFVCFIPGLFEAAGGALKAVASLL